MVAGYPGRTNRHRLATEVENVIEWSYPTRKDVFGQWLQIIEEETGDRPEAALKYASLVAGLNNAAKNYEGMLEGFAKSDVVERKGQLEEQLQNWIDENPERQETFRTTIKSVQALVEEQQGTQERALYYDFMAHRSSLLGAAQTLYRLSREQLKPDPQREPGFQERDLIRIRERLTRMDRTFDPQVDRAAWKHFLQNYAAIPTGLHVEAIDHWFGIDGNKVDEKSMDQRLGKMYQDTGLADQDDLLSPQPVLDLESAGQRGGSGVLGQVVGLLQMEHYGLVHLLVAYQDEVVQHISEDGLR